MSVKRIFDFVFAGMGLFILSPIFVIVSLLIKLDSSGPVFFRQVRVGQFGRLFNIYKFRTMALDSEKTGAQITSRDDPRITRVGFFLRKYKLDELPQLINVLCGKMSLVGPRPEVPRYVDAFKDEYEKILAVKPGITDFASLEYRNENDLLKVGDNPEDVYLLEILPDKITYYQRYLKEQSLLTDLSLIFKTIWSLFK